MILPFALLLAAQAADAPPSSSGANSAEMIAKCNARKFETIVQVMRDGTPHPSKVTICGEVGQSDADWANTLKDAMNKVTANPKMSPSVKDQIVTALKFEIVKLTPTAETKPAPVVAASPQILPTLAAPIAPSPPRDPVRVEYSALPPMPAPKPAATVATAGAAAALPHLPAPKLTLRCQSTTRLGSEGPCDLLERETLVTVVAGEDLPGGTSLRFLRRGDNRAEVDLAPLRRGQEQRFSLPPRVCQGVSGSRVQIEVIRAVGKSSQVVDSRGPFELRC